MKLFIKYLNYFFRKTINYLFSFLKLLFKLKYWIIVCGLLFGFMINYVVFNFAKDKIFYSIEALPQKRVGIVFGAKVLKNGNPSIILEDRLRTCYNAYLKGKISKILVSGDNSTIKYNEPYNMKKFLVKLGVNSDDVYVDYAGLDSYDTLYRAKYIFGVKEAVLFTQTYHLSRTVFIANKLGIDAVGMSSDLHDYAGMRFYSVREFFSRTKGFLDVQVFFARSKYLGSKINIK